MDTLIIQGEIKILRRILPSGESEAYKLVESRLLNFYLYHHLSIFWCIGLLYHEKGTNN